MERRRSIGAKIEAVISINPFEQQLDLDSLELGVITPLECRCAGERIIYLYSHTLNNDRSCSVSTGFVM